METAMPSLFRRSFLGLLIASGLAFPTLAAQVGADVTVPSRPETVVRGFISREVPVVAHVKPGQKVRIDALSQAGATDDAVGYFTAQGIAADQVLKDVIDVGKADKGRGHVLTGPVYIDGAEPGDMLEVRILAVDVRVPYGVNAQGPRGVVEGVSPTRFEKVFKIDMKRRVVLAAPGVEVPIRPFMGIMAVAPGPDAPKVSSTPPGPFGGNMDVRVLSAGSTLYLPVFNPGALFFTGDSHAVQGDGEVNGTAIEASMSPVFQFVLHKGEGKAMKFPWAEDADNYYIMGMDPDLDVALKNAVVETIAFLQKRANLSAPDAYSLSSIGVNFAVGEAVDQNLVIYGTVPKKIFTAPSPYWNKPAR
jgi:acetamidase/formamidase